MKKKKVLFHQDNAYVTRMAKQHKLHFQLLSHPPYSPDLAPNNYWLFPDLKRMLQGERFGSNEEVILETEAYFDKSFYKKNKIKKNKKRIKLLEKLWNQFITLERDNVDE